jgi:alkylation response protein AidB-like acyl-CoA dehydrogenase
MTQMTFDPATLDPTLAMLREHANAADGERAWPAASVEAMRQAGVLRWSIPTEYGGLDLGAVELLTGYERLASACLTSCFLLSQREGACRRIRTSSNAQLKEQTLSKLARGECFATVGLSQLTTSRQHGRPALVAREKGGHFVLDGYMPWVTGAPHADYFTIGAVVESAPEPLQILALLPAKLPGVRVQEPLELMALQGSLTAEVRCENVTLDKKWLLAGPAEKVLATGKGGAGGLETSALALGLAGAAIDYLHQEAAHRPDLATTTERLEQSRRGLREDMHRQVREGASGEAATQLRARANSLVLRATQAAMTAAKGAGYLRSHPAQRWARQALFFLVWSCPRPAADAMLEYLAPPGECPLS